MAILVKSVTIKNECMVQAKTMSATVEVGEDTIFFMAQIKLGDTLLFECPVEFLDLVGQRPFLLPLRLLFLLLMLASIHYLAI